MNIEVKEVVSSADLRRFIHLPARIHKGHTNWVPPVYMDDKVFFSPKKNASFAHSDTILLTAHKGKEMVGRVMGIINHKYNEKSNEKAGRFCFLETYDDSEVAHTLLERIETWATSKGMETLVGPLGFSDKDPQGLLVDGFDEPMMISTNCNYPYLVNFVEGFGFSKKLDLVVYDVKVPETIPEFYVKIHERALKNNQDLKLVNLKSKKDIRSYILPVLTLMNDTFKDIYAFTPLSIREMKEFASRYIMILDPRFIKILENKKKEVVAFILGIPDISDGIIKSKGYVLPLGIFKILRAQKKTTRLSLLLGGIHKDYRRAGIDTILGINMLQEAKKAGLTNIDSHLEMETHYKMRSEMEKMGGVVYKRYRIFQKPLNELPRRRAMGYQQRIF